MSDNSGLDILSAGLELPDEKKFYFNGFFLSVSPPDVTIVLQNNNRPVAYLNTSHTIAKTLVDKLSNLLKEFEKNSKTRIKKLDDYKLESEDGEPAADTQ